TTEGTNRSRLQIPPAPFFKGGNDSREDGKAAAPRSPLRKRGPKRDFRSATAQALRDRNKRVAAPEPATLRHEPQIAAAGLDATERYARQQVAHHSQGWLRKTLQDRDGGIAAGRNHCRERAALEQLSDAIGEALCDFCRVAFAASGVGRSFQHNDLRCRARCRFDVDTSVGCGNG